MAITINGGTNAITGLAVGGLPDGTVDKDSLAADSVDGSKILDDAVAAEHVANDAVGVAQLSTTGTAGTGTFLRGDNSWTAAGGGKLVQTVFAQIKPTSNISSTGTARYDTGLAKTITPTKAGSTLWINASGWTCHCNPGAAGVASQSLHVFLEINVNNGGWKQPDGSAIPAASTGSDHHWNKRDWHDHDYDGRDFQGSFSYAFNPTYTLGNAIQLRLTYGEGGYSVSGMTKYFHHFSTGAGSLITLIASEIEN